MTAILRPNPYRDPKMTASNVGIDATLLSREEAAAAGIEDDLPWIVVWHDGSHQGFETRETAEWRLLWWRRINDIDPETGSCMSQIQRS